MRPGVADKKVVNRNSIALRQGNEAAQQKAPTVMGKLTNLLHSLQTRETN